MNSILLFCSRLIPLGIVMLFTLVSFTHAQVSVNNPLSPEFSTITGFVSGALKVLVMVALPIISLFVVYSGFLFVAARGNESKLSEAKTNFFYVIIGSILILGAWVLATLLGGTVRELTGN